MALSTADAAAAATTAGPVVAIAVVLGAPGAAVVDGGRVAATEAAVSELLMV